MDEKNIVKQVVDNRTKLCIWFTWARNQVSFGRTTTLRKNYSQHVSAIFSLMSFMSSFFF